MILTINFYSISILFLLFSVLFFLFNLWHFEDRVIFNIFILFLSFPLSCFTICSLCLYLCFICTKDGFYSLIFIFIRSSLFFFISIYIHTYKTYTYIYYIDLYLAVYMKMKDKMINKKVISVIDKNIRFKNHRNLIIIMYLRNSW